MTHAPIQQSQGKREAALFSFGFRPFFLFGSLWAIVSMLVWLVVMGGAFALPTLFSPVSWHAHEFLFGYLGAVLAGFLLTAVPNWTGRLPIVGWRLAALVALWALGRLAVLVSATLPFGAAMAVDLSFPLVLGAVILREIIAGRNWRNLIVLFLLAAFTVANGLYHIENLTGSPSAQGFGLRLGVATALMMIGVIGGRIVPAFTGNWLARSQSPVRPVPPIQVFDRLVLLITLPALLFWVAQPDDSLTAVALVVMGILHLIRQARWQAQHTFSEPLVWMLHLSYAFIPAGALALGFGQLAGLSITASAQHLWMAGAIGGMTLAVMTRATLGHTGRALTADRATLAIYLCLLGAVMARVLAPAGIGFSYLSGMFWLAAFAGFAVAYGPLLWFPKSSSVA